MNKDNNIRQPPKTNQNTRARRTYSVQNSGYSDGGASQSKNSMKGYNADSRSPLNDIDKNLDILRKRSRNLFMTAPIATSSVKTVRTNVVGQGLKLKSRIDFNYLGMTRAEADEWEKHTEREFSLFADSKFCDIKRLDNFYELQQIALIGWLLNGDSFALLRRAAPTFSQPYTLRIQLVEADRVTTPNSNGRSNIVTELKDGNKILNGVEINKLGEVVAYHICNAYPSDTVKKTWSRVVAFGEKTNISNVIHVLEGERAEQYRGVPFLAPVIETLKQITRYTEAEVMAAVVNAMFTVFVEVKEGEDSGGFGGFGDDEKPSAPDIKLGTGTVNFLEPGESIKMVDPSRPNVNFDNFVTAMSIQIGGALEVPDELIRKRFDASYSASRAALMEAWKSFRMRRTWFSNDFCQPIYEAWLSEAIAKGRIKAPGFFKDPLIRKAYCGCEWNGPAPGQIDPMKEVSASVKKIEYGLSTREIETTSLTGGDYDKNIEQLLLEAEKMQEIENIKQKNNEQGAVKNGVLEN